MIWQASKEQESTSIKADRCGVRKRTIYDSDVENYRKSNSSLRQRKRLRVRKQSIGNHELVSRRSAQIHSSQKRKSKRLESSLTTSRGNLRKAKVKQVRKKHGSECNDGMFDSEQLQLGHISFKGLENLGLTCYFNAIVQCLFHCPLFRTIIENVRRAALSTAVLRELRLLFNEMTGKTRLRYLSTSRCFSAVMGIPQCGRANMHKDKQEDASEFFLILIDYLHDNFQPLADIFEGNLQSILTCQHCSTPTITFQPFKLIPLSFPVSNSEQDPYNVPSSHDIYTLLDDFVIPEIISGYYCNQCATRHPAEKKLDILSTPKVLMLQLKRFLGLQKIDDFVKFPSQLRLKFVGAGSEEHHSYRLTGVIFHRGETVASGHYIAYFNAEGKWWEADDSSIREVSWEIVRRMKVYLLFYLRL